MHFARAIGDALRSAYEGELDYHYEDGEKFVRVAWSR
jgi:hypothetical protein